MEILEFIFGVITGETLFIIRATSVAVTTVDLTEVVGITSAKSV